MKTNNKTVDLQSNPDASVVEREWEAYFSNEGKTIFQQALMFHRRVFISRAVQYWFGRYFPEHGVFIEAGAGTSESSGRIISKGRCLIAVDISSFVLCAWNILNLKVQADIVRLPIAVGKVDGVWNLGVMEHFADAQVVEILTEFRRILKPNGRILLFWPPWYAPYELILNSITWIARTWLGKSLSFFPAEINQFDSKLRIQRLMNAAGLELEACHFSVRDIWSYVVVVGGLSSVCK